MVTMNLDIPVEILSEILYLARDNTYHLRRVCKLWSQIVTRLINNSKLITVITLTSNSINEIADNIFFIQHISDNPLIPHTTKPFQIWRYKYSEFNNLSDIIDDILPSISTKYVLINLKGRELVFPERLRYECYLDKYDIIGIYYICNDKNGDNKKIIWKKFKDNICFRPNKYSFEYGHMSRCMNEKVYISSSYLK